MSGRNPHEIWDETVDEGERRLRRGGVGLLSTGFFGGIDVMLGVLALTVVTGALSVVLPEAIAHVAGSVFFGIGLVTLVIGRSELFTENFLVPVGTVLQGRASIRDLARLWAVTMAGNLIGLVVLALILTRAGLVPSETWHAAGLLADTIAQRDLVAAALSAVLAGMVMTLFTWVTHAVVSDGSRIALAMLIGFLLAAPSLNHAIVAFAEVTFGVLAGTATIAGWGTLAWNFPVSVVGNLIGGLAFVTLARRLQARAEPADSDLTGHDGNGRTAGDGFERRARV
jgi:formate/nitrite transporter FocA (FNT family)